MTRFIARAILLCFALSAPIASTICRAQSPDQPPILTLGDAVVSGFSGTIGLDPSRPRPANKTVSDLTFINPNGTAARVMDLSHPGMVWDGRLVDTPKPFDILAGDVGQVFGIALDDQPTPNIYLAATSAYGLNIVRRGRDGLPERMKRGAPGAAWMRGQFGLDLGGGPGAIYRIDGRSGIPSLFANVTLDGIPNPGPGLGNLAYDTLHKQLFVSDLYTGMIHRFDLDGHELGHFDHGMSARSAANLQPVPFDGSRRPNIASPRFDSEHPETWGYAPAARRVWGLAVYDGRLYYSVAAGPQIWSVGIAKDGSFADDPRWELDVPPEAGGFPVSDIAFSQKGAMILAQRAFVTGAYDYSAFTASGEPRVLRMWLKGPDDPPSPGRWKPEPEEYAVGFAGSYRNTDGGVALGYGYDRDGVVRTGACEFALWTTGENLRNQPALQKELEPGGPLLVHGLQGSPAGPVRQFNEPPWVSYFVDYDGRFDDPKDTGHLGSVRIYSQPCVGAIAHYGGPGYVATPPYIDVVDGGVCVGPNCRPLVPVDLAIEKTGSTTPAPEVGAYGFTLTVSNTGAAFNAQNGVITVSDTVPTDMTFSSVVGSAGWTCPSGSMGAGSTFSCSYAGGPVPSGVIGTITIMASSTLNPPFPPYTNCASVAIDGSSGMQDSDATNNRSCVTIAKPKPPIDVGIEKTGQIVQVPDMPMPGVTYFSYTLTVTNVGAPFSGSGAIVVSDSPPAGMTFTGVSANPSTDWTNCVIVSGAAQCTYTGSGPVSTGAIIGTITVTAWAKGDGPWQNCATVAVDPGAGTDNNSDNDQSCITIEKPKPPIDVAIEKTGTSAQGPLGNELSYTLTITNLLNGFAGNGAITVSDPAPAGVTYSNVTWTANNDWTCGIVGGAVQCTYIGSGPVAPNEVLGTIDITATATGDGPWDNCATVSVDPSAGTESNAQNNESCATLTPSPFTPVDHYPRVPPSCGVNVIFVVDVSGSIASAGATNNVIGALSGGKQAFNNVDSNGVQAQGAVITFSNTASVVQPLSAATLSTPSTLTFGGETNWEAAMQAALGVAQTSVPTPTVIVFITDGVPNRTNSSSGPVDSVTATNAAIPVVNQIYALGVPIFGVGLFNNDPQGPAHLHALLGGNDVATTYGDAWGAVQALAKKQCPDLYLSKSIDQSHINYYNNPGPHTVNVTLKLQNTGGAVTGVQVQDALPPELTNPTSTDPGFSNSGNVVNWNIGSLAANATASMTFTATIVPPTLSCNGYVFRNYAQVSHVDQAIHSTPNSFANPVTGPVVEHDEALAAVSLKDCAPTGGTPYLQVKKSSLESCLPTGQTLPVQTETPPGPCTFTVTVQAVGNFSGTVDFADGIFTSPGGTPVTATLSGVTQAPPSPTYCPTGFTTTAASCTENNVTLGNGATLTYTYTLAAPPSLPPGNYQNCFMAAQNSVPASQRTLPYFNANAPITQWNPWGDCGVFTIPASGPPPGLTVATCTPPMVPGAQPGECVCPEGTALSGAECIQIPPACALPMIPGPVPGQCICPENMQLRGKECVKLPPPPACKLPMVPDASGKCVCAAGLVLRGTKCVTPPPKPTCRSPFVLNSTGKCACPSKMEQQGKTCVDRKQRNQPTISPNDVLRLIPGLIGPYLRPGNGGGSAPAGGGAGAGAGGGKP